jgi:hypothetical protein
VDAGNQTPIGYSLPFTLAVAGNAQPVLGLNNSNPTIMRDGTWTGSIYLDTAASSVTLTASAGSGLITGLSGAFAVQAGLANYITVTAPSSVAVGDAFPVTISAFDVYNNPALFGTATPTITFSPSQTVEMGPILVGFPANRETCQVTLDHSGQFTLTATLGKLPPVTCTITVGSLSSVTYDGMLSLFTQAEIGELNGNSAAGPALQTLVNKGVVSMPPDVRYLANKVVNPSASDLAFLALYYYYASATWTVTVTGPDIAGFFLHVREQQGSGHPDWEDTTFITPYESAADVQAVLRGGPSRLLR